MPDKSPYAPPLSETPNNDPLTKDPLMAMTETETTKPAGFLKRWAPVGLIIGLMALGFQQGWHQYLTLESLITHRDSLNTFVTENGVLAIGVFMLAYIVAVALSFPGASLLTIASGLFFGWFVGGLAATAAATIGAVLIFLVARTSLGETLTAKAGPFLDKLAKGFQDDAASYLLFLRLVPAFPFWLVNLAPALFNVRLSTYVWTTFIGIIPGTFAYAFVGEGLDSVIAAQAESRAACLANGGTDCASSIDLSALVTKEIIIAAALLGLVALIPVVLKKLKARRQAS